jgi:hypothetical protein
VINFNTELTQEQARYIIEEVFSKRGYRIDNTTLNWWMKAHNFAFREQVGIPGCSCEMLQTYNVWNSRLGQYEQQIRDIAYPPIVEEKPTRGRKKK